MRRSIVVAGTIVAGAAIAAAVARRPLKAHLAEGTLPGRSGSWLNSYMNRPSYRLMAATLDLKPEDDLLDVACGWGEFLAVHASQARHVAGIDISGEKVTLARQRLADRIAAGTAEVVQGDAAALPWKEGTFSAVTCMDAFAFFPAPERVLAEVLRVLRPGGRMLWQIGMKWPHGMPSTRRTRPATSLTLATRLQCDSWSRMRVRRDLDLLWPRVRRASPGEPGQPPDGRQRRSSARRGRETRGRFRSLRVQRRSRLAFVRTDSDERAMAAAAVTGLRRMPQNG